MTLQSLPQRHRTSCGSPHRPCDMGWVQGAESKTRCGQPPESPGMATVALARGRWSILLSHTVIPPTAGPGCKRAPTRQVASLGLKQHRLGSCRWAELSLSLMWDSPGGGGGEGRGGGGGAVCSVEGHSTTVGPATRARHRLVTVAPALPPQLWGRENPHHRGARDQYL